MTGRNPFRTGLPSLGAMRPQEVTIAQLLKKLGYATGHFGKWHLGGQTTHPVRMGFDLSYFSPNYFDIGDALTVNDTKEKVKVTGDSSVFAMNLALDFIRKQAAEKQPFFAYVCFGSPHSPHVGAEEFLKLYGDTKGGNKQFLAEVSGLDAAVGNLRAELRKLGIADETIVWFASDNGGITPPQADDELGGSASIASSRCSATAAWASSSRARIAKLGRKVALKAMLPHLAESPSAQQRFLREARAAGDLEHDTSSPSTRSARTAARSSSPCRSSRASRSTTVSSTAQRPMPVGTCCGSAGRSPRGCAAPTARAGPPRHQAGQRLAGSADRPRQDPRLRPGPAATQEPGLTQQGAIVGTPAYMAPEQARGEPVDARCDLFSLGVVLYRLCTGQQPFQGKDTVSTLMAVAMNDPAAPARSTAKYRTSRVQRRPARCEEVSRLGGRSGRLAVKCRTFSGASL